MRLGILLFTPILLLAGVTLHAQEAVNAPEPAAAADSAANAELKAQLKAELLSEIRAELSSEVKTAVSKEADKPSRLTVGGYGEAVMTRNFFSDNYLRYISPDKYKNDKSHGRFDLPHVVIYLGYDFGRGWSMGTEIEFEHGGTESAFETEFEEGGEYESEIERGGEVALEQFWLQKSFSPAFNLRLGHMIVPVGGTNQHHMPTEFFGVYRPEGENTILPCTWHETGISLWGRAGDWRYEVMFLPLGQRRCRKPLRIQDRQCLCRGVPHRQLLRPGLAPEPERLCGQQFQQYPECQPYRCGQIQGREGYGDDRRLRFPLRCP